MTTAIRRRRGTTAQHSTFIGLEGETTIDTDKEVVVVHDGTTQGGFPLMRENGSNSALALGSAGTPSLKFTGDTNTGIYSPGTDQVAISTGGSGRLFVDASGNVGVGTSTPENYGSGYATLEARGTSGTAGGVFQTRSFDATVKGYFYVDSSTNTGRIGTVTNHPFVFVTNTQERLRITSAGLVGVGTSSPTQIISANGNIKVQNSTVSTKGFVFDSPASNWGPQESGLYFVPADGVNGRADFKISLWNGVGSILDRFYINGSSGNVGIGTSTPGYLLEASRNTAGDVAAFTGSTDRLRPLVFSSSDNTASGAIWTRKIDSAFGIHAWSTNSVERMRLTSTGLGIGTTSPGATLDVRGNTNINATNARIYIDNGGVGGSSIQVGVSGTSHGYVGTDGLFPIVFQPNNTERARIDSAGTFRVKGAGTAGVNDAVQLNGSAPANSLLLDASGRLLVGTSTARTNFYNINLDAGLQVENVNGNKRGIALITNTSGSDPSTLFLARSNSASIGSNTLVASGDWIGNISFQGNDGTDFVPLAAIDAYVDGTPGANDMPGRLVFSTTADGASSPTERMRITNGGLVGIGITAPTASFGDGNGFQVHPVGSLLVNRTSNPCASFGRNTTTGDVVSFAYGSTATNPGQIGTISVTASAVAYNTSSDYRLKENVVAVTDGITRLQQLKPSRFNFIADPDATVDGFIAHEVQTVVPEAITGTKDEVDADGNPIYQGIDQSKLVPLLTAALQEAIAKIESLEARLTAAGI